MRNITITIDDETARLAREYAATHNTSLSRLVADLLTQRLRLDDEYERAYRSWRSLQRDGERLSDGEPYPSRESLYDRPGLRRR